MSDQWVVVYHGEYGPQGGMNFYNVVGPFDTEKEAKAEQRRGRKNATTGRWKVIVRTRKLMNPKEESMA